ncbi:MAG: putative DNA binding domain-containing protein [Niameybacter sp.]|uniref:AlbA family DNA-binding domain-containing protein n=1 Tax=Niameybacter sp. TaxID=2033640 RepID=UPI002FCB0E19
MNKTKLSNLLKEEESFKLDFKLKLSLEVDSDKKEFVKDVIAMANTEGGRGYIVFGVEDKTKRIIGLTDVPVDIEERIQQIITYRSVPPVPVSFEVLEYKQKQVGILTIYKSRQVPHQMRQNGAFYLRRGSTTDVATRHELAQMLQAQGILSFEQVPCYAATLEDLDFNHIGYALKNFEARSLQQVHMLKALGILSDLDDEKKLCPTCGGLLLFGKLPQIFIPQALLQVDYLGRIMRVTGNISEMIKSFEEQVKPLLPPQYPFEALQEVVANAIIHRDYWNTCLYTRIEIKPESIIVINPRQYQYAFNENLRVHTNPWLYSRLLLMQQEEALHVGIGLGKVEALFGENNQNNFKMNLEKGLFQVQLPGTSYPYQ